MSFRVFRGEKTHPRLPPPAVKKSDHNSPNFSFRIGAEVHQEPKLVEDRATNGVGLIFVNQLCVHACILSNPTSAGKQGCLFTTEGTETRYSPPHLTRFSNTPRERFELFAVINSCSTGRKLEARGEKCSNRSQVGGAYLWFKNPSGPFSPTTSVPRECGLLLFPW